MSTQPPEPTSSAAPHPAYATGPATSSFQPQPQPQPLSAPQPQSAAPVDVKKARALTMPYRELAAFVLLGVAGAFLLAGFLALLSTLTSQFLSNAGGSFGAFVSIETAALPILAVLLATHVDPVVPKAKTIVLIALVEYAVAALFGLVMLLASLIGDLRPETSLSAGVALSIFLTRLGGLALVGLGLFLVIRVYLGAYAPPKPAPGVYGQPAYPYGQQGYQYPQQQYAQHPGYQQQPQTGGWTNPATTGTGQVVPAAGQQQAYATQPINYAAAAPASGAPAAGAPATGYNPQAQQAPYNPAATGAPGFVAPSTGAPAFTAPASGAPAYAQQPPATQQPAAATEPAEPVSAAPASTPPLSSPFAAYTAPAAQPVSAPPVAPPVSAPPAGSSGDGGATPSSGFAAAGWPGGSSTHPTSGAAAGTEQTGTGGAVGAGEDTGGAASPFGKTGAFPTGDQPQGAQAAQAAPVSIAKAEADPDATAAYTLVTATPAAEEQTATNPAATQEANPAATQVTGPVPAQEQPAAAQEQPAAAQAHTDDAEATQAHPVADPDATTAFTPPAAAAEQPGTGQHGNEDDGDDTQRTQVIPPKS
ncbi:hypothetical protein AB0H83_02450 [Dactylosporangium sp. NPDC050688]|uniref:hypothetical protein n=1 Tax=Dactylosporangium sp. NPDC050688 TaxID=3157217 RepID=UPI003411B558